MDGLPCVARVRSHCERRGGGKCDVPSGVLFRTFSRNKSPELMDASSGNRVKRRSVWVPLPTPGAPTRIMRAAFLSCLDAIDILDVLVDRVVVLFRTAQGARNGRVAHWVCVVGADEISEMGRYVIAGVIGYTSWTGAGLNLKNRFTDDAEATFLLIGLGGDCSNRAKVGRAGEKTQLLR